MSELDISWVGCGVACVVGLTLPNEPFPMTLMILKSLRLGGPGGATASARGPAAAEAFMDRPRDEPSR